MQEVQLGRLVILDVEEFPILRYWYVAHPIEKQLSIVSQTFLDYLKKEAKNINQDP